MAFDINGSGGDGDVMYDSGNPRRSQYAPSMLSKITEPWANDQPGFSIASPSNFVPTAPDLGRAAPPPDAHITTDHLGPQSPLDSMLGHYNAAEDSYKALLEKGPEQFHPSIWRRLAGIGLGTVAGIGGQRQGYGRYGGLNTAGNPEEAGRTTHDFVFGPQGRLDAAYKRQLEGARVGSDDAMKNYQLTRQQNVDDLQQRNIMSEMEARNRPQIIEGYRVPQDGGAASPIPISSTMPEQLGEPTNLPDVLKAKEQAPLDAAEARVTAIQKASDERQSRQFGEQEKLERMREDTAEGRQKSAAELKGKTGLQKVVDDARNIDALEQEQRMILGQVEKPEEKGGGKRGMLGGGPYLNGPQSMQFLANHMALTVGRIKGARTGKDLIEAHIKARDLDQGTEALASRILSGGVLTHEQAQQMFGTTGVKRASAWQKVRETGQDLGVETDDYVPSEYGGKRQSPGQADPPRPKNVPANATFDSKTRTWTAP